jgi:hypothetical protein
VVRAAKRKSALHKAEPTKSRGNKDHQAAAQPMAWNRYR